LYYENSTDKFQLKEVKDYRKLNDLEDVDTSGVVSGKILKHNGTQWTMADDG